MRKIISIYPYAFGSSIAEMSYVNDTDNKYRFGFNGEEKIGDISGKGMAYDPKFYGFFYFVLSAAEFKFNSISFEDSEFKMTCFNASCCLFTCLSRR